MNDVNKILIVGGNGFVGRQICRIASQENQDVISLSRSGKPQQINCTEFKNVQWVSADIFEFQGWQSLLLGCSAVIHTIGIIEEKPGKGITYRKAIYETARIVGNAVADSAVQKFVFLSASAGAPETPPEYMEWKKATERFLGSLGLQLTILRPGMIYGKERPETLAEFAMLKALLENPMFRDELYPNRPLPVETIASFALKAAQGHIGSGIYGVDDIENNFLNQ